MGLFSSNVVSVDIPTQHTSANFSTLGAVTADNFGLGGVLVCGASKTDKNG